MRASLYLIGFATASIVVAGIAGIGCSSSSSTSPPAPGPDASGEDASDGAVACTPYDASVATTDFGDTQWACIQSKCATSLTECAADCPCNDSVLMGLLCVQGDAGSATTCFGNTVAALAATDMPASDVTSCLIANETICAGIIPDGGVAPKDAAADTGASDAGSTDAGDAATTADAADGG